MPLSDQYVVQYLVQGTQSASHPICWQELETGGYWAEVKGVRVEVKESSSSTGRTLYVVFARGPEQVFISEPRGSLLFGRYDDEDERRLAELMRMLRQLVVHQCARRKIHSIEHGDELREEIFRCLVFGEEACEVEK